MLPISEFQEGDIFQEKYPFEFLHWLVLEVNKGEKMVKVQAYDLKSKPVGKPKWLSNNNKIFSESNLIMRGDGTFIRR